MHQASASYLSMTPNISNDTVAQVGSKYMTGSRRRLRAHRTQFSPAFIVRSIPQVSSKSSWRGTHKVCRTLPLTPFVCWNQCCRCCHCDDGRTDAQSEFAKFGTNKCNCVWASERWKSGLCQFHRFGCTYFSSRWLLQTLTAVQLGNSFTFVTNQNDPVPILPPRTFQFQHSQGEIHIVSVDATTGDATSIVSCPGQENSQCSEGNSLIDTDVANHLGN